MQSPDSGCFEFLLATQLSRSAVWPLAPDSRHATTHGVNRYRTNLSRSMADPNSHGYHPTGIPLVAAWNFGLRRPAG